MYNNVDLQSLKIKFTHNVLNHKQTPAYVKIIYDRCGGCRAHQKL